MQVYTWRKSLVFLDPFPCFLYYFKSPAIEKQKSKAKNKREFIMMVRKYE